MAIKTIRFGAKNAGSKTLSAVRSALARDGAVVFESLFAKPLLEKIGREVLRRHESGELRARGLVRDIGGRYTAVLPVAGPFLDPKFYAEPRLAAILAAALGPDYCLGSLEVVMALPGSTRQYHHADAPIRFDRQVGGKRVGYAGDLSGLPPYALALATPLCDIDEVNGPTALWPGSHKRALRARYPSEREIRRDYPEVRMTGKFGFSYLYDYRTFHRGMPNMSPEPRPLLMLVFTRPWFRDPNHNEIQPSVVVSRRNFARIAEKHRSLFLLAPAARRALWNNLEK